MSVPDLTIIYYTANILKESFAEKVRAQIKIAAGEIPIISVSRKPLDFGHNIVEETKERGIINAYKAILAGAKAAKTKYVALAEDDALYPPEHFYTFLPPENKFAYDFCRWNIFTWKNPPFFSLAFRKILATLIAPRQLLIDSIVERFAKYPDLSKLPEKWMGEPGREIYESNLGVTVRQAIDFYSYIPVIMFCHPDAIGYDTKKRSGYIRALELPYWGTAERVIKDFYL